MSVYNYSMNNTNQTILKLAHVAADEMVEYRDCDLSTPISEIYRLTEHDLANFPELLSQFQVKVLQAIAHCPIVTSYLEKATLQEKFMVKIKTAGQNLDLFDEL